MWLHYFSLHVIIIHVGLFSLYVLLLHACTFIHVCGPVMIFFITFSWCLVLVWFSKF